MKEELDFGEGSYMQAGVVMTLNSFFFNLLPGFFYYHSFLCNNYNKVLINNDFLKHKQANIIHVHILTDYCLLLINELLTQVPT